MAVRTRVAVFLDKDGTLVEDVPYNVDPGRVRLAPGAQTALRRLGAAGLPVVVVSNQSGVARGYFDEEALRPVADRLGRLLAAEDAVLLDFLYCPHLSDGLVARYAVDCSCRKPKPGLLQAAARAHALDLAASWMVGDILDDVEAGKAAGCRTILLDNGHETEWRITEQRTPDHLARDLAEAADLILTASFRLRRSPSGSASSPAGVARSRRGSCLGRFAPLRSFRAGEVASPRRGRHGPVGVARFGVSARGSGPGQNWRR